MPHARRFVYRQGIHRARQQARKIVPALDDAGQEKV
jgi:hypothetical protein